MRLANRKIIVNIGGRVLEAPPLDIEIDQTHVFGSFADSTVIIWNAAEATIGACQSTDDPENPKKPIRTALLARAGYQPSETEELMEFLVRGEIMGFKVERKGPDKALVINVTDAGMFLAGINNQTIAQPKTASAILDYVSAGYNDGIRVGQEVYLKRYVIRDGLNAVKQLCGQTRSLFAFRGGRLTVVPKALTPENPVLYSKDTGMIEEPTKIETTEASERGYLIKALYRPGVGLGSSVRAEWDEGTKSIEGVIFECKTSFTNFAENECELKLRPAA